MLRNWLVAILLALITLVVISATHRVPPPVRVATTARAAATSPPPAQPLAPRPAIVLAAIPDPTPSTPALDMMVRLAIRRRLDREGDRVYLDSMLAHTDSVLVRWVDHRVLTVALIADTTVPGWTPALLDEARAAMRAWDDNGSGMALQETSQPDSADIRLRWVGTLHDSAQIGVTTLNWSSDGVVHSATIELAMRRNTDSIPVPANVRTRVAIHEFGHALGLPHSGDDNDIMFGVAPVTAPSNRDQATLRLLYAVDPGPLRIQQ